MQRTNPQQSSKEFAEERVEYSFLSTGRVTTAPTQQSNGAHHVFVQESAAPSDEPIPVLPTVPSDYFLPPDGAPVVVAPVSQNDYAVIATGIPGSVERPAIDPGERIISHPASSANIHFYPDGSMDINSPNEVRINNGTVGAVTDVQAGSTNDNGGITSLDITRNDNILL